jgi:hypothetical protein
VAVQVHCTGYLEKDMKKFWSTKDPGQKQFSFQVGIGQVIKVSEASCQKLLKLCNLGLAHRAGTRVASA